MLKTIGLLLSLSLGLAVAPALRASSAVISYTVGQSVTEASNTPDAAAFGMAGVALVGLGVIGRKRRDAGTQ